MTSFWEKNPQPLFSTADGDGDRKRVVTRYTEAIRLLDESITTHGGQWGSPELAGEPEEFDAVFHRKIDEILESIL
jgi:hypothetical protein